MCPPFFCPCKDKCAGVGNAASPSGDKWQPTETKLEILRSHCVDQAIQAARAGYAVDAAEWRELAERVRGLGE